MCSTVGDDLAGRAYLGDMTDENVDATHVRVSTRRRWRAWRGDVCAWVEVRGWGHRRGGAACAIGPGVKSASTGTVTGHPS